MILPRATGLNTTRPETRASQRQTHNSAGYGETVGIPASPKNVSGRKDPRQITETAAILLTPVQLKVSRLFRRKPVLVTVVEGLVKVLATPINLPMQT